ncbi:MAG TPA: thrombospondin type 3 repeat-containing protein [Labilithrix sp.]
MALIAPRARADGAALDHLDVSDRGSKFFAADSLDIERRTELDAGLVTTYQHALRVFGTPAEGARTTLVWDQLTLHPGASIVFLPGIRVSLDVPVIFESGRDQTLAGMFYNRPRGEALGDVRFGLDGKIYSNRDSRTGEGVVVGAGAWVWLPSGTRYDYTSDGAMRTSVRVATAIQKGPLLGAARIAITYRRDDIDPFGGVELGSQLEGVAALGWHRGVLTLGPEVHGVTILRNDVFGHRSSPVEGIFGGHVTLGRFMAGAGVGTALDRGLGSPGIRALLSLEYVAATKPLPDRDGDGVPDIDDVCPDVPGSCGAPKARLGCPEPPRDRDSDGIPDGEDACPLVAGPRSSDPRTNGCADTDGDGVPDPLDACPMVVGVRSTDPKKDGCPAEPVVPPTPPAPPDRDHDGIVDAQDACPDEAGDAQTDAKNNGCPYVHRNGDKLVLDEPIVFDKKKPVLTAESDRPLGMLAQWLAKHPEVTKLRIAAHAEKLGPLTQQQADAVVERLVTKGVARTRLEPKGMGGAPGVRRRVELEIVP